jgi:hypothetical protein
MDLAEAAAGGSDEASTAAGASVGTASSPGELVSGSAVEGQVGAFGDGTSSPSGLDAASSEKQTSLLDRLKAAAQDAKEQERGA